MRESSCRSRFAPICRKWLLVLLSTVIYGLLFYLTIDFPSGSNVFPVWLLFVFALAAGLGMQYTRVPCFVAYLLAGFFLRNVPGRPLDGLDVTYLTVARVFGSTVFLLRVGLKLSVRAARRTGKRGAALCVVPTLLEGGCVSLLSYFLVGFNAAWSCVLGFCVSAVSHDVLVPIIARIELTGAELPKFIATVAPIDNLLALISSGVALGFVFFAQELLAFRVIRGPLEVAMAVALAIPLGMLCKMLLPSKTLVRIGVIGATALAVGLVGIRFGFYGGSTVVIVIVGGVIVRKWPLKAVKLLRARVDWMWNVGEPLLFAAAGAMISVETFTPNLIGLGALALLCGAVVRLVAVALLLLGSNYRLAERMFLVVSWLPKGGVPITIAAAGVEMTLLLGGTDVDVQSASRVLVLAALDLLLTTPLAALMLTFAGPRLLKPLAPEWSSGARSAEGDSKGTETPSPALQEDSPPISRDDPSRSPRRTWTRIAAPFDSFATRSRSHHLSSSHRGTTPMATVRSPRDVSSSARTMPLFGAPEEETSDGDKSDVHDEVEEEEEDSSFPLPTTATTRTSHSARGLSSLATGRGVYAGNVGAGHTPIGTAAPAPNSLTEDGGGLGTSGGTPRKGFYDYAEFYEPHSVAAMRRARRMRAAPVAPAELEPVVEDTSSGEMQISRSSAGSTYSCESS